MNSNVKKLSALWNKFWFANESSQSLALLRIFFGFVLFLKLTGAHGIYKIANIRMRFPNHLFSGEETFFFDVFHLPVAGFEWLPTISFTVFQTLEILLLALAVLFTIGLFTRLVGPLLSLGYAYIFLSSAFLYHHHVFLLVIVLLILGFSRCADHYSIDAYMRGDREKRPDRSILPLRLLQVLVSVIYLFNLLSKLNDGWFTGQMLEILNNSGSLLGPFKDFMLSFVSLKTVSISTLVAEGFLVFGLWIPKVRRFALLVGVLLHLGIDAVMDVGTFSYEMIVLYTAFMRPASGKTIAMYDGDCRFCTRSMRKANLLDWLRRVRWVNFRKRGLLRKARISLDIEKLEQEMYVVTPEGKILKGFEAWRNLLGLFPLSFIPSFLLYIPPVPYFGKKIYKWVAENRFGMVRCTSKTCE